MDNVLLIEFSVLVVNVQWKLLLNVKVLVKEVSSFVIILKIKKFWNKKKILKVKKDSKSLLKISRGILSWILRVYKR